MNITHSVAPWCLIALMAALLLTLYRLLEGPTGPDRVVALDLIAVLAAGLLGLLCLRDDDRHFLSVALVLSLISFLSTVALAFFIRHGVRSEGRLTEGDADHE